MKKNAKDLRERFPRIADLKAATPDKIGAALIDHIKHHRSKFHPSQIHSALMGGTLAYSQDEADAALPLVAEGIEWARQNFLLIEDPTAGNGWLILTRGGVAFDSDDDLPAVQLRHLLPEFLLHPAIRNAALDIFRAGRYQAAVFEAFKTLEVAIRKAAKLPEARHGVAMVIEAFHAETGPLRVPDAVSAERQALQMLMAGAVGYFKNPRSHRDLDLDDPVEAAEMLVTASHLMRIVEGRSSPNTAESR